MDSQQFRAHLRANQQVEEVSADPLQKEASIRFSGQLIPDPGNEIRIGEFLSVQQDRTGPRYAAAVQRSDKGAMAFLLPWLDPDAAFLSDEEVHVEYWKGRCAYSFDSRVISFDLARKNLLVVRPQWGSVARHCSRHRRRSLLVSFTVIQSRKRELLGKQVRGAAVKEVTPEGLILCTGLPLGLGDRLSMVLPLSETTRVTGYVARLCNGDPSSSTRYQVAASFTRLDPADHNRLVLYVVKNCAAGLDESRSG